MRAVVGGLVGRCAPDAPAARRAHADDRRAARRRARARTSRRRSSPRRRARSTAASDTASRRGGSACRSTVRTRGSRAHSTIADASGSSSATRPRRSCRRCTTRSASCEPGWSAVPTTGGRRCSGTDGTAGQGALRRGARGRERHRRRLRRVRDERRVERRSSPSAESVVYDIQAANAEPRACAVAVPARHRPRRRRHRRQTLAIDEPIRHLLDRSAGACASTT